MPFDALIFDLDGTLADTMPAHYVAWRSTMEKYGITFDEDRFYALGGKPSDKIVELLAGEQGIALDPHTVAIEKEEAFLLEISNVAPIEATVELVYEYRGRIPMAVATGAMRYVADLILGHIGLSNHFDACVTSEDTARHKPYPDVFLEAAKQLNVEPEHCRVYEDADLGVEAARRAGMEVVDVRNFFTPRRITVS
ncbi:HAD family hydrolase [Blastopirellula retiformator]|uniref:Fructose-1-phosphate phosphatase YqaB n=1 Tax=Blastopirellula retiformator TaxID=2527970 RepID=A0A5C5UWU0_9BACT|nr:beta-phosphoglucomutase family hydrolase [Blastopirellula retiformator]TWT30040.1 Fructose-1-phosphate phosphatase YqaB [Blastopirellula retiformator]